MDTSKSEANISKKFSYKSTKNRNSRESNDSYDNFNINIKNLTLKIKCGMNYILCLCILNDGRLVSGSDDRNIIIYNKKTYKPDLIIKEHYSSVNCIIKLNCNKLASGSADKTIKIFKIKDNKYEILQTLNHHVGCLYKILELKNKNLVSCSSDKSIIIYHKDNNMYKKDYKINTKGFCISLSQTKQNEICYMECTFINFIIYFYDLNERKIKSSISHLDYSGFFGPITMITDELLLIGGNNKIYIIDVNQYIIDRTIDIFDSGYINGFCLLNDNMFLTGSQDGKIRQWKINGEYIYIFSEKEKAHDNTINILMKNGNGKIISLGYSNSIKIW